MILPRGWAHLGRLCGVLAGLGSRALRRVVGYSVRGAWLVIAICLIVRLVNAPRGR